MLDRFPDLGAVLFDLDGTLLDTLADIRDTTNAVLERMGFPTFPLERFRYFVGSGVHDLARDVIPPDRLTPGLIEEVVEGFRSEYAHRWFLNSAPYPGIPEALDRLFAVPGLKIGILSNKPHDFALEMIARLLPHWTFHGIVGASRDFPIKPHPEGGRRLLGLLGVEPSRAAMVGDSDVDMFTARNLGAHGVGVSWGFRPVSELLGAGAELIVDHPRELVSKNG